MTPFTQLDETHIGALKQLASEVITGNAIHEDYFHDELAGKKYPPEAVVRPRSTAEVSAVLKYANDHNIPVTPRGQGTGLVGGSVSLYGGIMLDMTAMNRILEIDRENLTMTVEPGVLLMEIPPAIQGYGLFYPPDRRQKFDGLSLSLLPREGLTESECAKELGKIFPIWHRWCNVESRTVAASEFTVWETIAPAAAVTGYLLNGAKMPEREWLERRPVDDIRKRPGYAPLP